MFLDFLVVVVSTQLKNISPIGSRDRVANKKYFKPPPSFTYMDPMKKDTKKTLGVLKD